MKILLFTLCIFLFPSYIFSHNWFFGGNIIAILGFSEHRQYAQEGVTSNTSRSHITISPEIGYNINRFDFGINPRFYYDRLIDHDRELEAIGFGFGIFSRYKFIAINNFSILGQLNARYDFQTGREIFNRHVINVGISPLFEYRLAEHISIHTNFGIGGMSYSYTVLPDAYLSSHDIRFTLNSFFNLSAISIGFRVHF